MQTNTTTHTLLSEIAPHMFQHAIDMAQTHVVAHIVHQLKFRAEHSATASTKYIHYINQGN